MRLQLVRWVGYFLLIMVGAGIWFEFYVNTPSFGSGDEIVFIPKGSGVRKIKELLGQHGLIHDDIRFLILARLSGTAGRLRAGEYRIPRGLTPLQVLRLLAKGEVIHHLLTIPEGMTVRQIAEILTGQGWINKERFLELTGKPEFFKEVGLHQSTLEGYLFPDTYTLIRGETSEKSILIMMMQRFNAVWKDVSSKPGQQHLTRHEVVTLASMVEEEASSPEERPLIARVFFNRLALGMRLQSDPTVSYGLEDFHGHLTREDLKRPMPYNTYVIEGLPPGPICNPGRASLDAVLHPADAPYLYFVSKNDGTHYFSSTLEEHNRAVARYQKKK
jgi:UPF0755 protein